jgi:hypothetical protein
MNPLHKPRPSQLTGSGGILPPFENKRAAHFKTRRETSRASRSEMACGFAGKWHRYAATPSVLAAMFPLLALPAAAQELTTAVVDAGGGLTSGGEVEIAGSFGAFGDVSSGDDTTARAGFPAQLYDPARVSITPGNAGLTDNSSASFTAEILCDDDTTLAPDSIAWSVNNPLLAVTGSGEVIVALLPSGFAATLTATAAGVTGTAALSVFDTTPDDFGLYAGEGLPDAWQAQHFGVNNPDAAPAADPDADGHDNQTEYLAGTDPLDAASFLQLRFAPGPPPPGTRVLEFAPYLPGRTYTLESSDTLAAPWITLPDAPVPATTPGEGQFTDPTITAARKFYRLRIAAP